MQRPTFSLQCQILRARLMTKVKRRVRKLLKEAAYWDNLVLTSEEEVEYYASLFNGRSEQVSKFEEFHIEKEHPVVLDNPFVSAPSSDASMCSGKDVLNGKQLIAPSSKPDPCAKSTTAASGPSPDSGITQSVDSILQKDENTPTITLTENLEAAEQNETTLSRTPQWKFYPKDNMASTPKKNQTESSVKRQDTPIKDENKYLTPKTSRSTSILGPVRTPLSARYRNALTPSQQHQSDQENRNEKSGENNLIKEMMKATAEKEKTAASVVQMDSVPEISEISEKSPMPGSEIAVTPSSRTPLGRVCRQILETSASTPQIVFGITPTRLSKTRSAENCRSGTVPTVPSIRCAATSTPRRKNARVNMDQQVSVGLRDMRIVEDQRLKGKADILANLMADEKNVEVEPVKVTQLDQEKMEQVNFEKSENTIVSPLMIEQSDREDEKVEKRAASIISQSETENTVLEKSSGDAENEKIDDTADKKTKSPIIQSEAEQTVQGDSELLKNVVDVEKVNEKSESEPRETIPSTPSNLEQIAPGGEENAENVVFYAEVETDDVAQNVQDVYNEIEKCGEHQLFCITKMCEAAGNYFNERITVDDSLTHLLQFLNGVLQQMKMFRYFFVLGKDVIDHPEYENMEQRVVTTMYKIFFEGQELDMDQDIKQFIDQYGAEFYGNVNLNCIDILMLAREWFWIRKDYYSENNKTFNNMPLKSVFLAIDRIIYFKEVIEAIIYIYIPTFNEDRMNELTYLQNVLSFFREE